jgi:hypothetical protein
VDHGHAGLGLIEVLHCRRVRRGQGAQHFANDAGGKDFWKAIGEFARLGEGVGKRNGRRVE